MSSLGTLKSLVDGFSGAANIYGGDDKRIALNFAGQYLLMNYEIPEFIRTTELTFASGVESKPTNYLRYIKMFTTSDPTEEITRLDENDFDQSISNTWTIKWDGTSAYKLHIYPTDITTGKTLRYVVNRTEMSDDSDDSGFNSYWDDSLACLAAWRLLSNDRQESAAEKLALATELIQGVLRNQEMDSNQLPEVTTWFDEHNMFDE